MRIHFHGAAGEVTGSLHEVHAAGQRFLLDCGMVQGNVEDERRNVDPFPFEPSQIDALVISHAHIDHIGRVPLLVKRGYNGPIYAQAATADLMPIMLLDAASLAENEAERHNRRPHHGEAQMHPLYTREDVEAVMQLVRPLPYDSRSAVLPGVDIVFRDAGPKGGSCCSPVTWDRRTRRSCAIQNASMDATSVPMHNATLSVIFPRTPTSAD